MDEFEPTTAGDPVDAQAKRLDPQRVQNLIGPEDPWCAFCESEIVANQTDEGEHGVYHPAHYTSCECLEEYLSWSDDERVAVERHCAEVERLWDIKEGV